MVKITQMKKTTLRQVAFKLALVAFALLAPLGLRAQETLTVHDGTTTSYYVPAYIFYFDDYTRSQYVIPATELEDMSGGTINAIKFYTTSQNVPYTTVSTVDVYLMEVGYTTMTALEPKANGTIVYQGTLDVVSEGDGGSLTITLSTPYTYGGGNLLVGIENTTDAGYKKITFYGETVNGASLSGYDNSSLTNVTGSQRNYIPKTTFTYDPPAAGSCEAPTTLTFEDITPNTAIANWESNETGCFIEWKTSSQSWDDAQTDNADNLTYSLEGLMANTTYNVRVKAICGPGDHSNYKTATFTTPTFFSNFNVEIVPGNGTQSIFSWTETDVNFTPDEWQLCIDGDEDNLITMDANPFIYDGLTPEQLTTAKMRAFVDDGNGGSIGGAWSNTVSFTPTDSYIITLNEGSGTSSYVPIYYSYISYSSLNTASQFIIPASDLNSIQWADIEKLTFYANTATANYGNAEFTVYAGETAATTQTSFTDWNTLTEVYTGSVSVNNNMMEITFDNLFSYTTGNLLIGIKITTAGTNPSYFTWKGVSGLTTGVSLYSGYSSTPSTLSFLPQVTIAYTPGVPPSCLPPADLQQVANTTATTNSVDLEWTGHGESEWDLYYTTSASDIPDENTTPSRENITDNPYTLDGLTHSTHYYVYVRANCGGEQSLWSPRSEFTTACATVTSFPWSENFESFTAGTVPLCWDNSATTGTDYDSHPEYYWGIYSTNGNKMIRMYNYYAHGPLAIINTPTIVLPAEAKELTFDYTHNATSGAFSVKISVDDGETFTELQQYTKGSGSSNSDPGTFTEATISLADYTNQSVIIQFYSAANYGSGAIFIDNIKIDNAPTCAKPSALALDSRTAHSATLHWTNGAEGQNAWQIAYSTDANFDPNTVTPVDVTTNPATVEGLAQSTTYYAYVRANCGNDDYSAWNSNKVTINTLAGNATPTGLAVAANTITSTEATASWNAVAGNTEHQSYDIYWVESPDAAPVTAVPENPTAPNLISGITATSQVISDLTPETKYRVWVRDNCGTDGLSAWSSYVTFTTASSCNTPSNLVASNVTNNSAQLSWAAYGIDDFNLQYRVNGEEWDDNNIIYNVNTPYILSLPLTGNTTYQVRVQATCTLDPTADDSWSNTISFTTACDAESMPWSENFDTWTSKSVCWSFLSGQYNMGQGTPTTYSSAWTLNSSYGNYITIDGKALTMNIYSTNRYWAVTPFINITSDNAVLKVDVAVSQYDYATPNHDDNDTLAFAVSTDGGNTFTNLRVLDGDDLNNLGNDYTTIYVPVAGYNGQAVRFAIFGGSSASGGDNRCVIDNVSVEEAPSCYPVGTLTYDPESVTPFSANLSWTLIDNTQDGWRITYATNAELTENMHAITVNSHENYTLSGLTPETHYYVAVCAFCGATGYGAASNIIEFTTGIACQKPTDLAPSNIQQTSVDLSWTENGTASAWKVAYKDEDAADFSETMVLVNPYTLNGLTQGTNYTVKVRAICGGDYGNSQWSDEINFQTVAACPAPTNLAVTPNSETAHGATITWQGDSQNDSYIIEYAEGSLAGDPNPINEGFEGGSMPTGWTVDGNGSWSVGTGDYSGSTGAGEGTYNAKITHGNSGDDTKLITPAIDLSGVTTATLSFMHIERSWSGDVDELRVYYRTSSSDSWTLLPGQEYTTEVASWTTEDNINLPNPSSTYQIAFEMTDGYGYGVGIDNVLVSAEYNTNYVWNELASGVNGNTYTINTLDPETQYVVRMKGMCGTTPSPASNIVGFETPEACPAPTNVTVNNSTITDNSAEISWDGSASDYNVRYRTATYSPTYYFNDFNEPSATGWSYSAFIYGIADPITGTDGDHNYFLAMGWSTTDEETIISPELPAYSNGSVVEFYYFGYTTQNTFQVGYSSTTSDADAFTWGSPITAPVAENTAQYTLYSEALPAGTKYVAFKATASDQSASIFIDNFGIYNTVLAGDWTTTTASSNSTVIGGLTESTLYDVEVQAVCGSDLSAWVATTFTTLEACAAPTAFTLGTVTTEVASFSWTAGNGNTSWDVYVKAQGGDYPSTPNAQVTTPEATINNLVASTSYSVKIVPDCDDTKSLEVANAFHTLCSVIDIDADNPYFEDFEGTVDCWSVGDPEPNSSNSLNWIISANYSHSNSHCYSNGGWYGPVYLYTPTFNITGANAALSFWSYNYYISYYGKNSVLVTTDNGANWTEIWTPSSVSEEWVPTTIDLTAYIGQNIQLCFLYEGDNSHEWYIDDVKIGVSHAITASVNPTEAGTVTGAGTYIHGETVTLTANPNEGYQFVNWTKNDEVVSTDASYIFTANADADYVANFASYYTKNIDANKWYAISTPVHNNGNNETVAGVTNLTNEANDLYLYNEAESKWVKEATSLAVGKGYIYRRAANATLSFVGTANTGDCSATVTATTGTGTDAKLKGFNLIGNPYPHAISYENDHYTLNTNGTWLVHENGIIGVAEGFMVKVSASGTVDFEDAPATKSSTSSSSLAFTVSNGEFEDVAYARFENGEGLPKIGHLDANAPMLSIPVDGRRYAIANLGYDCENFDMNFRGTGEYTITLNTQHSSLNYCHLVDRTTGADIDLLLTPSYTFSANGSDAGRFLVKLAPNAQETTTGNFAYTDGRNWTVEGDGMLQVFDVLGRRIMTKEVSSQLTIPTTQFPAAGVYILRLGEKSQKIVVK